MKDLELLTEGREGKSLRIGLYQGLLTLLTEILHQRLLSEYKSTCGEHGIEIFEEQVLPNAFKYSGHNKTKLTKKVLKVIEDAGDYKTSKINDYLSGVEFTDGRRGPKPRSSAEEQVRELKGLLITYNAGSWL